MFDMVDAIDIVREGTFPGPGLAACGAAPKVVVELMKLLVERLSRVGTS